jgi:hypothetical protein
MSTNVEGQFVSPNDAKPHVVRSPLLRDLLHFYIGCQVEYPSTDGRLIRATLTGVSRCDGVETTYKRKKNGCSGDYLAWKENGYHDANAFNVKPILKRTTNMTDAEVKGMSFKQYPDFENKMFTPEQTIYLLKNGFDLFGLIDAGLAIEAVSKR